MQVELPFYEGPEDALRSAVQSLGGAKCVGAKVYPDKGPDRAAQQLLDCLNAGRPEKLELSQVLMILRMGRDVGCHAYAEFVARTLSYGRPQPIEPKDELGELLRQHLEQSREQARVSARIERLLEQQQGKPVLRSAA